MSELNSLSGSSRSTLDYLNELRKAQGRRRSSSSVQRKANVSFSLSELCILRIKRLAEVIGCSESEVVRRAVDEYYLKYYSLYRDLRC